MRLFYLHFQMTWVGKEYCLEIVNRCEPTEEGRKKQILGIDGEFSNIVYFQDHLKSHCKLR